MILPRVVSRYMCFPCLGWFLVFYNYNYRGGVIGGKGIGKGERSVPISAKLTGMHSLPS